MSLVLGALLACNGCIHKTASTAALAGADTSVGGGAGAFVVSSRGAGDTAGASIGPGAAFGGNGALATGPNLAADMGASGAMAHGPRPAAGIGATGGVDGSGQATSPTAGGAGGASRTSAENAWRMMGYDLNSTYYNPVETGLSVANAKQLTETWRFTVSGFPCGTPVIAEGKVFAMATGGLYAIDLEQGKATWTRTDISGTASVFYEAGYIYAHTYVPATVYKLKASDGSTVWGPIATYDSDYADGSSSPIVAAGKVIVGHSAGLRESDPDLTVGAVARGAVEALDATTGQQVWTYYTEPDPSGGGENGASVWSTVTIDLATNTVYATTGNSYTVAGPNSDAFHAIDLATGNKKWVMQVRAGDLGTWVTGQDQQQDTDFGANPILGEVGGRRIVAAGDKGSAFWALDRDNGQILWSHDKLSTSHSSGNGGVLMNGAFDGSYFYVVSNDPASGGAVLHKLDPTRDGASAWQHSFGGLSWGAPSLANGLLLVPNDSVLYVMSAETGDVLTSFETGGTIAGGAAAIAQGKVVVKSGVQTLDLTVKNNDQIICYGLSSAGSSSAPSAGAGGHSGATTTVGAATFSAIYQEIIVDVGCNGGQCHSGPAAGGLSMRSKDVAYTNLVGVAAMGMSASGSGNCADSGLLRVAPGDPDKSLLMMKLQHTQPCGGPMPSTNTTLPAPQLQQVRMWIANGAVND